MSGSTRIVAGPGVWVAAGCIAALLAAAGCEQQVVTTSYGGYGSPAPPDAGGRHPARGGGQPAPGASNGGGIGALFGGLGRSAPTDSEAGPARTIALADFDGPNRQQEAERFRARLASRTGAEDLWLSDEGERIMLYHGRYGSVRDERARADLERWRRWRDAGTAPVPYIMVTPVPDSERGGVPEYELSQAATRGSISLQIGIYDGEDRRPLAEQAVTALREDGHEAYYYHGPNFSHVTIGAFPASEINDDGSYGPALEAVHQEFPHNLANGRTLRQRHPDGTVIDQPSFPVDIPGSPDS